jgi:hypothetical protein
MKTIQKISAYSIATMMLVTISLRTSAIENLEVITEDNSKVVRMELDKPIGVPMDVILKNNWDRVIYQNRIDGISPFEHSYDFGDLRDGTYKLVSSASNLRLNRTLEVRDSEVEVTESYTSFQPQFKLEDDKLMVHYIMNEKKDIGISIQHGSDVVYDGFYGKNDGFFSRVYALDELEQGSYTIQFVSKGEFYTFEFELD